jgi:ribosomal protein L11 methyltransferase
VNQLFEWGAQGVEEGGAGDSGLVRAFFEESKRDVVEEEIEPFIQGLSRFFPDVASGLGATKVVWNDVEDENWADSHKKFYEAQELTRLFFLKPAWDTETPVPDGMLPLILEPGQAFGTGLHASTRLCVRLLEYFVELHSRPETIRALDVGTGTGILAMVLSKLGVAEIVANDNDPIALEVASDNLSLNECSNVQLTDEDLQEIDGKFEIIVSNILLETHRELAVQYRRLLTLNGQIILSGLLGHQKLEIVEIMSRAGFALESEESSQDWIALAFTPASDLHSS